MKTGLRIAVEGNIGVGKSTILPKLKEALCSDGSDWEVLDERVDQDPEFKKLLADFYEDPNKQAQLQAWITYRRLQEFKALSTSPKNYLFERSFFGEIVFCHANFVRHEKPEGSFMNYYYNIVESLRQCQYDALIYLKASPESCFERIRYRSREQETTIKFDYVRYLHACYETHLVETARVFNVPLVTVDWENFGAVETVKEQLMSALEVAEGKQKAIL